MTTGVFIVAWLGLGVFVYAAVLGHFQNKFPELRNDGDFYLAIVFGVVAPLSILPTAAATNLFEYGFRLIPKGPEQKGALPDGGVE